MKPAGKLVRLRPVARAEDLADASVVAACALGDRAARAMLFERHVDAVASFVARMRGSDTDAVDDLVQATFLGAFRSAGTFRGERVRAWLYGIAANVVRNYARGEIRRKQALRAVAEVTDGETSGTPGRAAVIARLPAALATLPEDLRAAVVLVDLQGETGADAAAALGIPTGTLWRHVAEARQMLRGLLGGGA